jgi:hypothetical protein
MPKNALAPTPANAFNMAPYEARYRFQKTPKGGVATDVEAALVPALMRAHFPEYVQNARATVSDVPLNVKDTYGQYISSGFPSRLGPEIQMASRATLHPNEYSSMNMLKMPGGGYVGTGDKNTTTDTVLNALGTLMHEGYHARMQPNLFSKRDANETLKKMMGKDKYNSFMIQLEMARLPSVQNPKLNNEERLNEFLSTAVPTKQMLDKGIKSSDALQHAKEIKFLVSNYPELKPFIDQWTQPEKQPDTYFTLR